jgi:hypothetical protein
MPNPVLIWSVFNSDIPVPPPFQRARPETDSEGIEGMGLG